MQFCSSGWSVYCLSLVCLMFCLCVVSLATVLNIIHTIFFNFKFIYFNWRLITLQYCIGSATHQHEFATGVHVFPILNPLPPPSPYHPSGSSQCTRPKHPVSNLDWRFISYMILYMFPWHSTKSSHPLPLSQSPKDCSIHLCLLLFRIQGYCYPSF